MSVLVDYRGIMEWLAELELVRVCPLIGAARVVRRKDGWITLKYGPDGDRFPNEVLVHGKDIEEAKDVLRIWAQQRFNISPH